MVCPCPSDCFAATSMTVDVTFFGEDHGHEAFCIPLIEKVAKESGHQARCFVRSASGGRPKLLGELAAFVDEVVAGGAEGELVVVATDANCVGRVTWEQEILGICAPLVLSAEDRVVTLCPDPHIERWMLLDSQAFRDYFGRGCQAPDQKCERDRYKDLLVEAIVDSGVEPTLGGMEFADEIVARISLDRMVGTDESLGQGIADLRRCFRLL